MSDLTRLGGLESAKLIRAGEVSSRELVGACLAKIEETDADLKAWQSVDAEFALAQADRADQLARDGRILSALHGVPVGIKDIIDTKELPTEHGSPIFQGRMPGSDAALVTNLKSSGAVILGKTKTTEFAFLHPTDTRNPHDADHIPGGSSSGSAASVAAFQVPLAIGTQTGGSVIRPASFCGVYGFKPARGHISRHGVLTTSASLDTVGVFARDVDDTAALASILAGDEVEKPSYSSADFQNMRMVWLRMPHFDRLEADTEQLFDELRVRLGSQVAVVDAPEELGDLVKAQEIIHEFEICRHLSSVFKSNREKLSETILPVIDRTPAITPEDYANALNLKQKAETYFHNVFSEYDVILNPSTTGEAPRIGGGTGDPAFCKPWSLTGLPAITLPLLTGRNNLPVGVQVIGRVDGGMELVEISSHLGAPLR